MALTATEIQARIDALQKSRDAGVLNVRHGADSVTYQSLSQMDKVLARLKAELASVNGTTPRSKLNYLRQESKGYGQLVITPPDVGLDWTD